MQHKGSLCVLGHILRLEWCIQDQHGPCARMTKAPCIHGQPSATFQARRLKTGTEAQDTFKPGWCFDQDSPVLLGQRVRLWGKSITFERFAAELRRRRNIFIPFTITSHPCFWDTIAQDDKPLPLHQTLKPITVESCWAVLPHSKGASLCML
eukprot:1161062-Pelagomonas_calceolata.AAC.1